MPPLFSDPTPHKPAAAPADLIARVAVTADVARGLVTYTIAGLLDQAAVRELGRQQAAAMAALRCVPHGHVTIIDISACKVQPQQIIEMFRAMLADPRHQGRRLAIVTGCSAARMQIRRVLDRDGVAYVDTVAAAEAWLFAGASAAPDRVAD